MNDATEMILTTLAVVLAGTVFAVGAKTVAASLRKAIHEALVHGLHRRSSLLRQQPAGGGTAYASPGLRAGAAAQARRPARPER